MSDVIRIGMLGCGTVGQGVVRILRETGATIERATGHRLEIGPILVRDLAVDRPGVDLALLTTDPEVVLGDEGVDILIEVMGGVTPTYDWLLRALGSGTSVVTANKQLLARHGPDLLAAAQAGGSELRFEASVCAAIPVIKVLRESLLAAEIVSVMGIVNGTTNFILTEMRRSGVGYPEAVRQAQELGYAEADPTEDVGGGDAAAKMAILSSIAFHTRVLIDDVHYSGIDDLQGDDVDIARDLGFTMKLLGVARLVDGAISVRVHPALVPDDHPLASVNGSDNAVLLESETVRQIMLVGPGAGGTETASAVVSDVLSILGSRPGSFLAGALVDAGRPMAPEGSLESAFYLRLEVADEPGVLARVSSVLGECGVSILTVVQRGEGHRARLVMILHRGPESTVTDAIGRLSDLPEVRENPVLLHVVGTGEAP
ncbi:MAG: homoserine dehydrogenase [Thermoleophilia bacterium]|nr:homoserine dehydrogenase [Thermoleophilia bacterium]